MVLRCHFTVIYNFKTSLTGCVFLHICIQVQSDTCNIILTIIIERGKGLFTIYTLNIQYV